MSEFARYEDLKAASERIVECGPRRYLIRRLSLEELVQISGQLPIPAVDEGRQARRRQGASVDPDKNAATAQRSNARLLSAALLDPKIPADEMYILPGTDYGQLLLAVQELCALAPPFEKSPPGSGNNS